VTISLEQSYDDSVGTGVERGEPIDLSRVGHECRAKWRTGAVGTWRQVQVAVGELDDGRWFVERVGQIHGRPRAYSSKAAAWHVARQLMAAQVDAEWERVPCYPSEPLLRPPRHAEPGHAERGEGDQH
jgi:hypothetical protein